MAGFTDDYQNKRGFWNTNPVGKILKDLSRFGMRYDDMLVKNSRAVGYTQSRDNRFGYNPTNPQDNDDMYQIFANLSLADTTMRKKLAFHEKGLDQKIKDLFRLSQEDEIEEILDTLTNECIVYNDYNQAAEPMLYTHLDISEKIKKSLHKNFKKIYNWFGFYDGKSLWEYFKKWLITGFLAFEIIYDDDEKNIIGFKEMDPLELEWTIDKKENIKVWIQHAPDGRKREIPDSNVIYISYASQSLPSRTSYAERLVRSFNLLRIMEHTRVIWAVTNSQFKMKFVIPMGGKSKTRAKQSLAQLMNNYREVVDFDYNSAELFTNGKPMMPFNKEYWLPSRDGQEPMIDTMGGQGPVISDTEALKYFSDKLKLVSKIPFSRFEKDSPATQEMTAEGMVKEEIKFSKFTNRLRSVFQELLIKPLYIQMVLDFPELKDDEMFKTSLGLKYNKDNVFEELKQMELNTRRIDYIRNMKDSFVNVDANMNEQPVFDMQFLLDKHFPINELDFELNEKYKQVKKLVDEGYTRDDAWKIAKGEVKKSKIKPKNAPEKEEGDGSEDSSAGADDFSDINI
jgi:hypothetical protein